MKRTDNTITVTIYGNRGEHFATFPARWVICPDCDGCATDRGASVECDGGGFTSSEWRDLDDDFRADYLSGRYDRPCGHCKGLGRVHTIDRKNVTGRWALKLLAEFDQQERVDREISAIHAAERRMGA